MKSFDLLWKRLANELASWCHTSIADDYKKLISRVNYEGISFYTITLPQFDKDLCRALEVGFVDSNSFAGFKRKNGLPLFLGGFLNQIFDPCGTLFDEPDIDSIFSVRQLCCLYGKMHLESTEIRKNAAMKRFVECERELSDLVMPSEDLISRFKKAGSLLYDDVFSVMDKLVYDGAIVGRHGPGKTADRLGGNIKYDLQYWPKRLERTFAYGDYAIPSWRYYYRLDRVVFSEPDDEIAVKVISVPKDAKTPRIIAIEPTCMQYMQQALLVPVVQLLETDCVGINTRRNLVEGFIGFTDQQPNRDLAKSGSQTGCLATLDLSEASDRVLVDHVRNLLVKFPHFLEGVEATRSRKAQVLTKEGAIIVPLRKFASMGSGLCFPMEAMVFLAIVFVAVSMDLNVPLNRKLISSYRGKIRVYGDDIIVPVEFVSTVKRLLETFGLKVNANKTFHRGKFRESCGGDYYDGQDVTPVRVRRVFPTARSDSSEVISLVSLRNQLYKRGLWDTCRWLDDKVREVLPRFPPVKPSSPALGRHTFLPAELLGEWIDARTHTPKVKAYVDYSLIPESIASGEGSLMKCLRPGRFEPFEDAKHLIRQGRPLAVGIKLERVTPY